MTCAPHLVLAMYSDLQGTFYLCVNVCTQCKARFFFAWHVFSQYYMARTRLEPLCGLGSFSQNVNLRCGYSVVFIFEYCFSFSRLLCASAWTHTHTCAHSCIQGFMRLFAPVIRSTLNSALENDAQHLLQAAARILLTTNDASLSWKQDRKMSSVVCFLLVPSLVPPWWWSLFQHDLRMCCMYAHVFMWGLLCWIIHNMNNISALRRIRTRAWSLLNEQQEASGNNPASSHAFTHYITCMHALFTKALIFEVATKNSRDFAWRFCHHIYVSCMSELLFEILRRE